MEEVIELMVNLKELREIGFYLNQASTNSKYGSITQVLAECVDENGKLQVVQGSYECAVANSSIQLDVNKMGWVCLYSKSGLHSDIVSVPLSERFSGPEHTKHPKDMISKNHFSQHPSHYLSRALNTLSETVRAPWVVPQRRTDDKTVVRYGIGHALSRIYEEMDDREIVYHAARTGQISAALAFLAARRMNRLQGNRDFVYTMQLRELNDSDGCNVYLEHVLDGAGHDSLESSSFQNSRHTDWLINQDHMIRANVPAGNTIDVTYGSSKQPLIMMRKPESRYLMGVSFDWLQNEVGCLAYNHLGIEVDNVFIATRML